MNLAQNELTHVMKDRQKIGASLADIDPMSLDRSVSFFLFRSFIPLNYSYIIKASEFITILQKLYQGVFAFLRSV